MQNIDQYIQRLFVGQDPQLEAILDKIKESGMPPISISPESGKCLTLLVKLTGARRILEIGVLGGYSGLCLCRGLSEAGTLTSLELQMEYAQLAHQNLTQAGFGDKATYLIGEALDSLKQLEQQEKRFDFFFIDADKENYVNYLEYAIRLAEPGALIVADNTMWDQRILDQNDTSMETVAIRTLNERMANDPRLDALLIPIGDGLTVGRVK
jgi:predicted O-methyltransferase YrrM